MHPGEAPAYIRLQLQSLPPHQGSSFQHAIGGTSASNDSSPSPPAKTKLPVHPWRSPSWHRDLATAPHLSSGYISQEKPWPTPGFNSSTPPPPSDRSPTVHWVKLQPTPLKEPWAVLTSAPALLLKPPGTSSLHGNALQKYMTSRMEEVTVSPAYVSLSHRKQSKMKIQSNMFQRKGQDKNLKKKESPNEIEIGNDKKFKGRVIKMLTNLGRRIEEYSENVNNKLENIKKNQLQLKDRITEMKDILEGIKN